MKERRQPSKPIEPYKRSRRHKHACIHAFSHPLLFVGNFSEKPPGLLVEGSTEYRSAWHIPPGGEMEVIRVSFAAETPGEFKVCVCCGVSVCAREREGEKRLFVSRVFVVCFKAPFSKVSDDFPEDTLRNCTCRETTLENYENARNEVRRFFLASLCWLSLCKSVSLWGSVLRSGVCSHPHRREEHGRPGGDARV